MRFLATLTALVFCGCTTTNIMSNDKERTGVYLACLNITSGMSIGVCSCVEANLVKKFGPDITSDNPDAVDAFADYLKTCVREKVESYAEESDSIQM